jgi:ribonuclease VapC
VIIDSSAVLAILTNEPERPSMLEALSQGAPLVMSAATYLEAAIVVDGRMDPVLSRRYDELLAAFDVQILDVTLAQARRAREAYRDYGRGSASTARLNFGDCFSYALASERDEPLLFKGNDFRPTDLRSALSGSTTCDT